MNSGAQPREEHPRPAGKGGAAVNATIELERDRRHRLRWWTWAVLPLGLLSPREGSGVLTMIDRVTQFRRDGHEPVRSTRPSEGP
jgi:hypothetical protein